MKKKSITCWIVWILCGHSDTATGESAEGKVCNGCKQFIFKR
jgi:hypothetical protein